MNLFLYILIKLCSVIVDLANVHPSYLLFLWSFLLKKINAQLLNWYYLWSVRLERILFIIPEQMHIYIARLGVINGLLEPYMPQNQLESSNQFVSCNQTATCRVHFWWWVVTLTRLEKPVIAFRCRNFFSPESPIYIGPIRSFHSSPRSLGKRKERNQSYYRVMNWKKKDIYSTCWQRKYTCAVGLVAA